MTLFIVEATFEMLYTCRVQLDMNKGHIMSKLSKWNPLTFILFDVNSSYSLVLKCYSNQIDLGTLLKAFQLPQTNYLNGTLI